MRAKNPGSRADTANEICCLVLRDSISFCTTRVLIKEKVKKSVKFNITQPYNI